LIVGVALPLASAGCASVELTQEIFAKRQVEVDEHFLKVETDVRDQGDRIDRAEVRVGQLDRKLAETRQLARNVGVQPPPPVMARATPPEPPAPRPAPDRTPRAVRTLVAVVHVPFGFDRADLDAGAEAALTTVLKELRENTALTLDLEGSTDNAGRADYNIRLSQRRVEAVKRWLVAHGVERTRIVGSTARGVAAGASVKEELKRRVMVKLMSSGE
jgi:outer membrane protein OmpA-like peptidoglycan-associated protein